MVMKAQALVKDVIIWRMENMAYHLDGRKMATLSIVEREAWHMCRELGLLTADFGPRGESPGVLRAHMSPEEVRARTT